jgi:hypothetical protein
MMLLSMLATVASAALASGCAESLSLSCSCTSTSYIGSTDSARRRRVSDGESVTLQSGSELPQVDCWTMDLRASRLSVP